MSDPQDAALQLAVVEAIHSIGEGSRVCLDCADVLSAEEGVLVGDTGYGYLLLLAETRASATYPPRPFRVNAGAVHQYLSLSDGKTAYLSDLRSAQSLTVWSASGQSRAVPLGRIKLEKRPLLRIECQLNGQRISATVQDSESVYLLAEFGAVALKELKQGDRLRARPDVAGRHLGQRIEESIEEY